ncbi:hypothetical protein ABFS83_02G028100 [Erythranthe nasuta]
MEKMIGGKKSYLAMKTDYPVNEQISSDFNEIGESVRKLANHAIKLGGIGFGTSFLKWVASFAAIYLLILDRTNWKTKILTSLLIPYIFLTLPSWLFGILRGEIGRWIAFVAVVLRLFIPKHFPDWLEMPGSLILLLVVSPGFFADSIRGHIIGTFVCLVIGCYLLQEHIRASGGFRNSFTRANGISNSVGILLLFVYPVWALVLTLL